MKLLVSIAIAAAVVLSLPNSALAQNDPGGIVVSHSGKTGNLIVSRDTIVYWLAEGDNLFEGDIIRAQTDDSAIITFNGCTYSLPGKADVVLDGDFCALASVAEPSMALIASEGGTMTGFVTPLSQANAPLIVGGVILSAGGIAATTGGDSGGTGSTASQEAGASASTSGSTG